LTGCSNLVINNGHFYISGFFTAVSGQIWWFRLEDLRWSPTFLIRTAESYTDYTGGSNQYVNLDNFVESFKRIIQ
jgi:hypothetical protein